MALTVHEVDLTPEEARRKLIYLQVRLWREQFEAGWFVRDFRSDVYLRNELIAFWEGRITEVHGWLDLLDQTVEAFRGIVSSVFEWVWSNVMKPAIDAALAGLWWIADRARDLIVGALQTAVQVGNWLWTFMEDITAPIRLALTNVWNFLVETVSGTLEAVGKGLAALPQAIAGAFQSAISYIIDVVLGAARRVCEFFAWLGGEMWKAMIWALRWLWDQITGTASSFFNWIVSQVARLSQHLKRGEWEYAVAFAVSWVGAGAGGSAAADIASTHVLGSGLNLRTIGQFLLRVFDPRLITTAVIGTIVYCGIEAPVRQYFNKLFRPRLPDPETAMRMYWRGKIDEEQFKDILRRHGFDEAYVEGYRELANVIPGISDLIRFAVREAFPVETPEEQLEQLRFWAARQGLSSWWADRYWIAHWQLPAFGNLQEAFWRGIIDEEDYRKFILKHDYRPDPWPGHKKSDQDIMFELSYRMPGAIETRWMLRWGLLSYEEFKNLMKCTGIHPDWLERVCEGVWRQMLTDERSRLLAQLRYLYREGQLSLEDFTRRLKNLYFSDAEIGLIVEAANVERQRVVTEEAQVRYREATRADYTRAFRLDLISEAEFREALTALRYPPEVVDLIVSVELALKERAVEAERKREIAEAEAEIRKLTKADLSSAFKLGLISEEEYRRDLIGLGYRPEDAGRIIALDRAKAEMERQRLELAKAKRLSEEVARLTADERNSVRTALQSLYVRGIVPREALASRLRELGFTESEIALTVEAADYKLQQALLDRRIDAAVMEYRYGKITLEQLSEKLAGLGLSTAFVQNILEYERARTKTPVASTPEEEVRAIGQGVVIRRYREGLITPVELEQELALLGYSPAERERLKILADLERDYNFTMEVLNALRSAFRRGKISEARFRRLAADFGIADLVVNLVLQLEKIRLGLEEGVVG